MSIEDFLGKPLMTRRFVTFVDDPSYVAIRDAETKAMAEAASSQGGRPFHEWVLAAALGGLGIAAPLGRMAYEALRAYLEAKKSGVPVEILPASLAQQLTLPPNHPQAETMYAVHPVNHRVYVPISDFHRFAFNHKFAELIRLLSYLGAVEIVGEHVQGFGREILVGVGANVPQAAVEAGAEAGSEREQQSRILYKAELDGAAEPSLPEDLAWFEHEPTWKAVAEQRLKFGLRTFDLHLDYNEDYGVNAGLKVKAENAGFHLQGSFERHENTVWRFSGKFKSSV